MNILIWWKSNSGGVNDSELYLMDSTTMTPAFLNRVLTEEYPLLTDEEFEEVQNNCIIPAFPNHVDECYEVFY